MKRLALCIGNNDYVIMDPLGCAISDADEIADSLCELGFETICRHNLDRSGMIDVISDFIEKLADYDSCVFYYAGHGFQIEGENILAPVDLDTNDRLAAIKLNGYPLEELMRNLDQYPDKTKVFVFDACRTVLNTRGTLRGFAPLAAPQGSIIAFATSPGQSSGEDTKTGHGNYTNALLQYIKLPRVNVETVFKKTREQMVATFGARQIPWEHTSLVGDYFLNPNTIYDGVNYCPEALADSRYHTKNMAVKQILEGLKSYNWYTQMPTLKLIYSLSFDDIAASDLFVIGRNIYQAAVGGCFDAQTFIDSFVEIKIPAEAKLHMLNGMAYEIYFTPSNTVRIFPKVGYYNAVIRLLEMDEFYGSKSFIASVLCKIDDQIFYVPGQNEIMEFIAEIGSDMKLKKLMYKGANVLFKGIDDDCDLDQVYPFAFTVEQLVKKISDQVVAPTDCVQISGIEEEKIHIPIEFTLRKRPLEGSVE